MNQFNLIYDDYNFNLSKGNDKMENFNLTTSNVSVLDENCLDEPPIFNKFLIDENDTCLDSFNQSNSVLNTFSNSFSSTVSNSSSINLLSSSECDNSNLTIKNDLGFNKKFDTNKPFKKNDTTSKNSLEITKSSYVMIKKRKVGVNHKFVNNPKHSISKKTPKISNESNLFLNNFQYKNLFKNFDLNPKTNSYNLEAEKLSKFGPVTNESSIVSTQNNSTTNSSKGMGCGKPGYITCSICNATKYYSHVQRRFGQFSCEPCSKFMKRFLKDPKVYYCVAEGDCQIGKPSGEQEPRGVSVNRCKACWLKICLEKFVLDDETKEVIDLHYMPKKKNCEPILYKNSNDKNLNSCDNSYTETLPPLPLSSSTRKKKNLDDDIHEEKINKVNNYVSKKNDLSSRNKKKFKLESLKSSNDDYSSKNKRERKKKLIYSPPSTPKRTKKRLKNFSEIQSTSKLEDNFDCSNLTSNYYNEYPTSLVKQSKNNIDNNSIKSFEELDDLKTNKDSFSFQEIEDKNESNEIIDLKDSKFKINCNNCKNCSSCFENYDTQTNLEKNTKLQDFSKILLNQNADDFSSEDYIVEDEESSELSYETIENTRNDYMNDKFFDFKSNEEELDNLIYEKKLSKDSKMKNSTSGSKKNIKKKDILTNNLLKKSFVKKKNLSYIFSTDSNLIFEILNANSPFL